MDKSRSGRPAKRAKTEVEVATDTAIAAEAAGPALPAAAGPAVDAPCLEQPWVWASAADWLRTHNGGQWAVYASKFDGLLGRQLCDMTEEQMKTIVDSIAHGITIFNDIAKLKNPAASSSSESRGSAKGDVRWDSENKLLGALEAPVSGGLVTIPNLDDAGVKLNNDVFYVREQLAELWATMGTWASGHYKVQGPPGTGKSTTLWYWCLTKALSGVPVLWIHLSREDECIVCDVRDGEVHRKAVTSDEVVRFVKGLLGSAEFGLIVVDGVTDKPTNQRYVEIRSVARVWLKGDIEHRTLVYCASEALTTAGEDEIVRGVDGVDVSAVTRVCSWSLNQYKEACAHDGFWEGVQACVTGGVHYPDPQAAVEDKFILAGASARWMFGRMPDKVMSECDSWVSKVSNVDELVSGVTGTANHATINHLRAIYPDGRPFIVSEYAMRALIEWNKLKSLEHLANVANTMMSGNPTFDGWVFELDFLTQLKVASKSESQEIEVFTAAEPSRWSVSRFTTGVTIAGVMDGTIRFDFAPGQWLVPKRFNHGAFDAVQFIDAVDVAGKLRVRFVNVTRAGRHDVKCIYLVDLLNALEERWDDADGAFPVVQIEFVWIRPYARRGDPAVASHVIDDWQLKQPVPAGFGWDATTADVFIKRTGGDQ